MPKVARPLQCAIALLACTGCPRDDRKAPESGGGHLPQAPSAAPAASVAAPLAGERVDVPGGVFQAGSFPGDRGRRPELEMRRARVELGPFRIDRMPFPNDPARSPTVNVTREAAERSCAEQGTRLCTELEWERACKGPESRLFTTGDTWDDRCEKEPKTCASAFDVLGMGALREWTSSDSSSGGESGESGQGERKAVLRGAPPGAAGPEHRCAARTVASETTASETIGFRCCKGAKNAAQVVEPRAGTTFVKATLPAARLQQLLEKHPKTAALAKNVRLFRDPDGADTVVARGPGDRKGFFFTVAPLLWNPVPGAEFLVVSGRSGDDTAFVVVFHVLGTAGGKNHEADDYLLASSFVMEHEVGPVALAYNGYIRPRLHFSTCWGCPGETGKILYRDPDSVAIFQP